MLRSLLLLAAGTAFGADLIVVNANVITVDQSKPHAEAFAVENGRILRGRNQRRDPAVGHAATQSDRPQGQDRYAGIQRRTPPSGAVFPDDSPYSTPWLGPDKIKNMDELIAALKKKADRTPKGLLVHGTRYDDVSLGRHPNRHDLDKASTDHPISISHASGHIIAVNSYILEASGITKETKDPPGGSFDRDPDGTPNGVIREGASRLSEASSAVKVPPEEEIAGLVRCFQRIRQPRNYQRRGWRGAAPNPSPYASCAGRRKSGAPRVHVL